MTVPRHRLVADAIGALAMALSHTVSTVVAYWALIGVLDASLLLPAIQPLIHAHSTARRAQVYATAGASAAIAAAFSPLIGLVIATY